MLHETLTGCIFVVLKSVGLDQSDNTASKTLALHAANLDLVPGWYIYTLLSSLSSDFWRRAKINLSNAGVAPKPS